MKTANEEKKIQFILDENRKLVEMSKEDAVPVQHPIKVPLKNAFEVFVRVKDTENYWISNYGRCVNNLNCKKKDKFYEHKQGKCHYTVFEIERVEKPVQHGGSGQLGGVVLPHHYPAADDGENHLRDGPVRTAPESGCCGGPVYPVLLEVHAGK